MASYYEEGGQWSVTKVKSTDKWYSLCPCRGNNHLNQGDTCPSEKLVAAHIIFFILKSKMVN